MKSTLLHLIVWLLICAATLAGYGYWYHMVASESTTVADLQNQITAKAEASTRVAAARAALADIAGDESLVQSYFVADTAVVPFIDDLESRATAQSADMKVLSVSTSGTAKQSSLVLLLTLSIDGTFDAVMRTIGSVEYSPYDLSLSKLAVTKSGKNAWHADLQLTIGSVSGSQATSTSPTASPTVSSPKTTP
jgi:hypothetical protein